MASKSGNFQLNFTKELKKILTDFTDEMFAAQEQALDKAADFFVDKLKDASPVKTGTFRNSWTRTEKYKGVRYIGNTAMGGKNEYGYEIPLANIIEFSKNGKPFIRRTFENNKNAIVKIVKDGLNERE